MVKASTKNKIPALDRGTKNSEAKAAAAPSKSSNALLVKIARSGLVPRVLLCIGTDRIRKTRLSQAIFGNLLKLSPSAVRRVIRGGGLDDAVLHSLALDQGSPSLFSAKTLIVIDDVESIKAAFVDKVLAIATSDAPSDLYFLLLAETLPSTSPFRKQLAGQESFAQFADLAEAEMAGWALRELKSYGIEKVPNEVLALLISASEGSLDTLAALANHLALYSNGTQVTVEEARELFSARTHPSDFVIVDQIRSGQLAQTESLIKRLLDDNKSPFGLLGLINRAFSSYLAIKSQNQRGVSAATAQKSLDIKPWLYGKHLEAIRPYSASELRNSMGAILKADSTLKNRALGPDLVLSQLAKELAPTARTTSN